MKCLSLPFCDLEMDRILISNGLTVHCLFKQTVFFSFVCFLLQPLLSLSVFFSVLCFPLHLCLCPPAQCNTSNPTLPSYLLDCYSLCVLPLVLISPSLSSSFTPHLPPTHFMQQIGTAGCHDVKLVAPRLAGMASFLWWHNVVAMSYTFKQWFDVTAVSVSLSNAGGGCHIPAGSTLSNKLMSAAQLPHHHKNFLPSHTFMKVLTSLTKPYYIYI